MKKAILFFSAVILMASCSKVLDQLGTFRFSRSGEFTIPATSLVGQAIVFSTGEIETAYIKEFESNGFSVDKVDHIKLTKMVVRTKLPVGQSFDFLKSVSISISADGLSEIQVASKLSVADDGSTQLEADVSGEDLKPYIMKEKFQMKASAELDQAITQDIIVEVTPTFEVSANLL